MEAEAAVNIWKRSADTNLHYVVMLSDGDSNSYPKLQQANVYGDAKPVIKEECINHVAKRLKNRLKKLVPDSTVDDGAGNFVPLGGARGLLPEQYMERLKG